MKKLFLIALLAGSIGVIRANTYDFSLASIPLDHSSYYTWGFKGFSIPSDQVICEATLTLHCINNWTADEDTQWIPQYGPKVWDSVHYKWVKGPIIGYTEVKKNWLRSWLLDTAVKIPSHPNNYEGNAPSGLLKTYSDTDNGPDNFLNWSPTYSASVNIGTYTDAHGGLHGDVIDLTYKFSDLGLLGDLAAYIANGHDFALGFDPDCHYDNHGITFEIETCPKSIPDGGATLILLALGLLAIPAFKRLLRA